MEGEHKSLSLSTEGHGASSSSLPDPPSHLPGININMLTISVLNVILIFVTVYDCILTPEATHNPIPLPLIIQILQWLIPNLSVDLALRRYNLIPKPSNATYAQLIRISSVFNNTLPLT